MAASGEAWAVGRGQSGAASADCRTCSCSDRRHAHADVRGRRRGARAPQPSGAAPATKHDEATAARLQFILDQARVSDHVAREKAARRLLADLQEKLANQLSQLSPWSGDIDQLGLIRVPTSEQIEDWRGRAETIRQALVTRRSEIEGLTNAAVELAAKIDSIKTATGLVDDTAAPSLPGQAG